MTIEEWVARFWCCLNPAEKAGFILCSTTVGTGGTYVVATTFDALWLLAIEGSPLNRRTTFLASYGLTAGTVPDGSGGEISVFFLDLGIWIGVYLYSLTDAALCADGCAILEFTS